MGQLLEVRFPVAFQSKHLTPCGQRSIEMQGHFLRIHWTSIEGVSLRALSEILLLSRIGSKERKKERKRMA